MAKEYGGSSKNGKFEREKQEFGEVGNVRP